jgi:hypothetical protein
MDATLSHTPQRLALALDLLQDFGWQLEKLIAFLGLDIARKAERDRLRW